MKTTNPLTGRSILVNGPTFERLLNLGYNYHKASNTMRKSRGSTARVGRRASPQKQRASQKHLTPSFVHEIEEMGVRKPRSLATTLKWTHEPAKVARLKQQMQHPTEGRGSRTRGWRADSPRRGTERHLLKAKCGSKCFLAPDSEGFPICPKCLGKRCVCRADCRGLLAAEIRAKQYGYKKIAKTAVGLRKRFCA